MHHMTCPNPRKQLILRLWVMLAFLPLSSVAWAAGTESIPRSLIQRPPVEPSSARLAPSPIQAQTSPYPVVPHTLLKKPKPPSPPLLPATAVPSVSAPLVDTSASSISGPAPVGTAFASGTHSSPSISTGRSATPLASALSPRAEASRLPGPLQRLFRDNPAFGKLLQVAPPDEPPPSPSSNNAILTWTANKESDLAGYRIYV
jgi:hypothetical protein